MLTNLQMEWIGQPLHIIRVFFALGNFGDAFPAAARRTHRRLEESGRGAKSMRPRPRFLSRPLLRQDGKSGSTLLSMHREGLKYGSDLLSSSRTETCKNVSQPRDLILHTASLYAGNLNNNFLIFTSFSDCLPPTA